MRTKTLSGMLGLALVLTGGAQAFENPVDDPRGPALEARVERIFAGTRKDRVSMEAFFEEQRQAKAWVDSMDIYEREFFGFWLDFRIPRARQLHEEDVHLVLMERILRVRSTEDDLAEASGTVHGAAATPPAQFVGGGVFGMDGSFGEIGDAGTGAFDIAADRQRARQAETVRDQGLRDAQRREELEDRDFWLRQQQLYQRQ